MVVNESQRTASNFLSQWNGTSLLSAGDRADWADLSRGSLNGFVQISGPSSGRFVFHVRQKSRDDTYKRKKRAEPEYIPDAGVIGKVTKKGRAKAPHSKGESEE